MTKPALTNLLIDRATARSTSARREAQEAADFDLARRQAARTILKPNEVSGEYDTARVLTTTLGGVQRPITLADLRAFQQNVARLKKAHADKGKRTPRGGITAQGVIDLALAADKERANKEIRMSVPASIRGDTIHFITNSGPDSDVSRHHVHVQFLDFATQVAASPNDAKKIGKAIASGKLKFNCDCGRHTYWYRYVATVGNWNYGRNEDGFPKIRNPRLVGVACKHALRTMHVILKDAAVQQKIAGQVLKAREVLDARQLKVERTKAEDLRKMADAQQAKRRASTNLKTSAQRNEEAAKRKLKADMLKKAAGITPGESPREKTKRLREDAARLQSLLASGILDQAMFKAAMANLEKQKNA
jgi:hypothetical protein